jgi:phenylalanyl-tRNA synthetase beta chain
MRVPLRWLEEYVSYPWTTPELAHRLTMSGLKIESVDRPGELWSDIRIGQVVDVGPHPRSTKPLHVAHVHYGDGVVEIVTGAQNVHAGAKVPVVLVGGTVPFGPGGKPLLIEPRPMAGIPSNGMLCSPGELGLEGDDSGIMILPDDAPLGAPLAEYLGEDVLDIETVSNRPDTLSMIGVAREVGALAETALTVPDVSRAAEQVEWIDEESVAVQIEDEDLCSRYTAVRIEGITVTHSPDWLGRRLEAAGLRAINLIVDLTNYVMLECGQPMHAFDGARLSGGRIVVRRAREGEQVRTLDGVDRVVPEGGLVIADGERAVAIAGVMGGEESEITQETTTLILESANFNAPSVRKTAQVVGLRTDASSRFEKGLPPETTEIGVQRFVQLLGEITGEPVRAAKISDVWPVRPPVWEVAMPIRDVRRLLGIEVSTERAAEVLGLLGFDVRLSGDVVYATVPYWRRVDIERSADLVEEVGRIVGFETIPSTLPFRTLEPPVPSAEWLWEGRLRERLLACGINEAVTHSMTSTALMARLGSGFAGVDDDPWERLIPNGEGVARDGATVRPIALVNPATVDRRVMRLTLLPSLLDVVAHNAKQSDERLAFFEIARTYFPRGQDQLAYERRTLGVALSGRRTVRSWQNSNPDGYSFFDCKGIVEAVLDELGIREWSVREAESPMLHPGRAAELLIAGEAAGVFGELHPEIAARFELDGWPVQVAELDLDVLVRHASADRAFARLPRYPVALRDVAVVVDRRTPAELLVEIVREAGGEVLEFARIFDVYEGAPLPEDRKSVAVEMRLRSADRTLGQGEVDETVGRIVEALRDRASAELRE